MKAQIFYSFKELLKHPLNFVILFFQSLISFCLFFYGIHSSLIVFKEQEKIVNLVNNKPGYCLKTTTDNQTFMKNSDFENNKNFQSMYSFMDKNKNFKFLLMKTQSFNTYKDDIVNKLPSFMYEDESRRSLNSVMVNKNFQDIFDLSCSCGELFNKEDFLYNDRSFFVVLGNDFKKYFKVKDKIKITDSGKKTLPYEGRNIEFIVKGFLEEGSYFINFNNGNNFVNLDKTILIPAHSCMEHHEGFKNSLNRIFDEYLSAIDIVTNDINSSINEINQFGKELSLYTYSDFFSWKEYKEEIVETNQERSRLSYFLFFSIFLFSVMNVIFSLFIAVKRESYKIGIHILCGCRINDIILRFFLQISFTIFLSLMLSLFLIKTNDLLIIFLMILLSIVFVLLIVYFLAIKIKNKSVNLLLLRRE